LFTYTVQAAWGICKGRHWDWAHKWQCDIDRKAKAYNSKTSANRQIGKAPTSPLGGAFVATRGRLCVENKPPRAIPFIQIRTLPNQLHESLGIFEQSDSYVL